MLPTLKTGDVVVVDRFTSLEPGDMVAAAHPYKKSMTMIKRIESINSDGRFMLIGDNSDESTDSRAFGSISRNDIAGKVIARLSGQ